MHRLFLCLICFFCALAPALAQSFSENQPIEYLDYGKWEPGVYLYLTPSGKQAIIRRKPSEYFPQGDTAAWELEKIRPKATPAANNPRPQNQEAPTQAIQNSGPVTAAGGPLSKAEILGYLEKNLGNNPFGPNRQQVQKDLAALIKARGLNFVFQNNDDFSAQLDKKFSPESTVRSPLWANSGPPPKEQEYMGTFKLQVNVNQHHSTDGVYRYTMDGGANSGSLTVNPDGSYLWNGVRGRWRSAREDEKRDEGGAAIVLVSAKGGEDWIVYRNRQVPDNWIKVVNLREPNGLQEHGHK